MKEINRPELFLLSREVVDCSDFNEVEATYKDMEELGIAKLPYSLTDVEITAGLTKEEAERIRNEAHEPGKSIAHFTKPQGNEFDCQIRFCFMNDAYYLTEAKVSLPRLKFDFVPINSRSTIEASCCTMNTADRVRKLLIVLLATKNIVKTRTKDKLLALGIGKHKRENFRAIYTTTLSLPPEFVATHQSREKPAAPGVSPRPHLRRGHKRDQRHGPKNQFIKVIWIEPCFVNADETYISQRFSYNGKPSHALDAVHHSHECFVQSDHRHHGVREPETVRGRPEGNGAANAAHGTDAAISDSMHQIHG